MDGPTRLARQAVAPRQIISRRLLRHLYEADYSFVRPTNETLSIVRARRGSADPSAARDLLGWGRAVAADRLAKALRNDLLDLNALQPVGSDVRSGLRASSVDDLIFLHGNGESEEPVFLGPDTYRFVRFLDEATSFSQPPARIAEIGCGSAVAAIRLARRYPHADVVAGDLNPDALCFAAANAAAACVSLDVRRSNGLQGMGDKSFDLVVANPPFIAGGRHAYREGGDALGTAVAREWISAAITRRSHSGRVALYCGAPIVNGHDDLKRYVEDVARQARLELIYREIDPDIFSATLRTPPYRGVDRIAAIGLVLGPSHD